MSLAHYMATKQFERKGELVIIGQELILQDEEAEELLKDRKISVGRDLDPTDPKEKELIKAAEAEYNDEFSNAIAKEEARDEQKADELIEEDSKREELITKAQSITESIAVEKGEEVDEAELKRIAGLSLPELEVHVETLEKENAPVEDTKDVESSQDSETVSADGENFSEGTLANDTQVASAKKK